MEMKKLHDEVKITHWDRWEDPGDYPNNIASKPLPPGPWYPEATEGHALYEMTEEDWDRLEELDEPKEIADFFEMNPISAEDYLEGSLAVTEAEYERVPLVEGRTDLGEDYAVVIPIRFGKYICGPDLPREVLKVKMLLQSTERLAQCLADSRHDHLRR
jgi:hypothetical protein